MAWRNTTTSIDPEHQGHDLWIAMDDTPFPKARHYEASIIMLFLYNPATNYAIVLDKTCFRSGITNYQEQCTPLWVIGGNVTWSNVARCVVIAGSVAKSNVARCVIIAGSVVKSNVHRCEVIGGSVIWSNVSWVMRDLTLGSVTSRCINVWFMHNTTQS